MSLFNQLSLGIIIVFAIAIVLRQQFLFRLKDKHVSLWIEAGSPSGMPSKSEIPTDEELRTDHLSRKALTIRKIMAQGDHLLVSYILGSRICFAVGVMGAIFLIFSSKGMQ